jgi:plastocyanin
MKRNAPHLMKMALGLIVVGLLIVSVAACSSSSSTTTTTKPTTSVPPTTTTAPPTTTTVPPTTTTVPPTTTTVPPTTTTVPPTTTPSGQPVTIDLIAQSMAFDKATITVPAGAAVTINFNNKDSGVPHNFALYTNSSATTSIFEGAVITGPKTITYTFKAPSTPGSYFFRCDIHPTFMTGTFIVQ